MADEPLVVDGIEVHVTMDDLRDYEIIEAIEHVNRHGDDQVAQVSDVVRLLRLAFGDDYERVKSELREANGGRLSSDDMIGFFNRVSEEVGAKNS